MDWMYGWIWTGLDPTRAPCLAFLGDFRSVLRLSLKKLLHRKIYFLRKIFIFTEEKIFSQKEIFSEKKISARLASCSSSCHFLTWSWFLFSRIPIFPILTIFIFLRWELGQKNQQRLMWYKKFRCVVCTISYFVCADETTPPKVSYEKYISLPPTIFWLVRPHILQG